MCKLASRVFFTVTTRKLRSKQVISIQWKRLVAFFVIMVIFNCLAEYGLRTKKFLSLFAKLDSFKGYQQKTKHCLFPFSLYCSKITLQFEINDVIIVLCLLYIKRTEVASKNNCSSL